MLTLIKTVTAVLVVLLAFTGHALAGEDGDGSVRVSGELKAWHKVTLTIDGPWAKETDTEPNPFTDYRLSVRFKHQSGKAEYNVPGYFSADGNAGETSATQGNQWRVHFTPSETGQWDYTVYFFKGKRIANGSMEETLHDQLKPETVVGHHEKGSFMIAGSDKTGRDLRAHMADCNTSASGT